MIFYILYSIICIFSVIFIIVYYYNSVVIYKLLDLLSGLIIYFMKHMEDISEEDQYILENYLNNVYYDDKFDSKLKLYPVTIHTLFPKDIIKLFKKYNIIK